jgi:hypothetical protein
MKARVAFLLLAWLAAFTIVMALFVAFGARLEELPLALRALAISGVLVVTMSLVVTPLINRFLQAITGSTRPVFRSRNVRCLLRFRSTGAGLATTTRDLAHGRPALFSVMTGKPTGRRSRTVGESCRRRKERDHEEANPHGDCGNEPGRWYVGRLGARSLQ